MSEQFDESTGTALLHMVEDLQERMRKVEARVDAIERQSPPQDTNKHGQEIEGNP